MNQSSSTCIKNRPAGVLRRRSRRNRHLVTKDELLLRTGKHNKHLRPDDILHPKDQKRKKQLSRELGKWKNWRTGQFRRRTNHLRCHLPRTDIHYQRDFYSNSRGHCNSRTRSMARLRFHPQTTFPKLGQFCTTGKGLFPYHRNPRHGHKETSKHDAERRHRRIPYGI
jgi:hypothetical protein